MSPEEWRMFLFGLVGSLAVEVANIVRLYEAGKPLAARYKRPVYLIARVLLSVVAGVLAFAYNTRNDLLSFHIGVATPAILQLLSANPPTESSSS
jgi:hypothetical protein